MKKNRLLLVIPILLMAACQSSQKKVIGPLTLSTDRPQAGEKIFLQYQTDSGHLAGAGNVEGTFYYAVKETIYTAPISLTDSGKIWKGSFSLPDSAQAFALSFSSNAGTDNNNGKGYVFAVTNKSGQPIRGSLAAASEFYSEYFPLLEIKQNTDTAMALIQKDISTHPSLENEWQAAYLKMLLISKRDSAYPEIKKDLKKLLSADSVSENSYNVAIALYQQMKMSAEADSLKQVALQKYPEGQLAMDQIASAFGDQNDLDSMVALYDQFRQKFRTNIPNSDAQSYESSMMSRVASTYIGKGQYDKAMQLASRSSDRSQAAGVYNEVAWSLAKKGTNLSFADSISKVSLDILQEQIYNPDKNKPTYLPASDWKKIAQRQYGKFADTYAMILFKEGKQKDALQYQKTAVDLTKRNNTETNEHYLEYLVASGDYATAQQEAEKFIENGRSNEKMVSYLKTAYTKQKGSAVGYPAYIAQVEEKTNQIAKEKLKKEMIDKPATLFSLPDLKGENISLASMKGKVVIIDFWATWCVPCKASFPGMQLALNKYKSDSSVVFLFVNTWERLKPDARKKEISDFIAKNNYSFHVLLDQPEKEGSSQFKVVSDYGVEAIPAKFVIDPDGHIRFKMDGFGGNTENEVREISNMIDILKG